MSHADVIATLGLPENIKTDENNKIQLGYKGYNFEFTEDKLSQAQLIKNEVKTSLILNSFTEINPNYKADSIILNKDINSEVSAYQVAAYLNNETLFLKAIEVGVNPNGFTIGTNAICIAMMKGFLKGLDALIKNGYDSTIRLRKDNGVYIFPDNCVSLQKNIEIANQINQRLKLEESKRIENEKQGIKKDESKSFINWDEVKNFLKPTSPAPKNKFEK